MYTLNFTLVDRHRCTAADGVVCCFGINKTEEEN